MWWLPVMLTAATSAGASDAPAQRVEKPLEFGRYGQHVVDQPRGAVDHPARAGHHGKPRGLPSRPHGETGAVRRIDMTASADSFPHGARIVGDVTVPAGLPWSGHVAAGQVLRLVDLEGQQAIDFLCYAAHDHTERYSAANTIKIPGQVYLGKGSVLRSSSASAMMTIIEDTCGGHDTIFGCCSFELDEVRYGATNARCCQRNFEEELARHGMDARDVVANVNFFMRVPVGLDGSAAIVDGQSRPGDFVDLRADMDVLAVLSNCPEALNPATGGRPTPVRAVVYAPPEADTERP